MARPRATTSSVRRGQSTKRPIGSSTWSASSAAARLDLGAAGLRPEVIVVADVLGQTAERFRQQAAGQGVQIIVVPVEAGVGGQPMVVTADRLAVERILANLTANALAALTGGPPGPPPGPPPGSPLVAGAAAPAAMTSPTSAPSPSTEPPPIRGHIWLSARRLPPGWIGEAPTAESVVLEVPDAGPGFGPGTTERVFERFYRADPARAGTGSGLGLAIVRELARAHGGDAVAENVAPHGARLSVILPVMPVRAPGGSSAG